ncbi:cytochrome P450 [Saccharopolyspora sp. 6V]|uniref:cytochrome P450 n=1 Tax=Saccharopolyspora sp. 6V TaxID=2877239 RepID=UPI001CD4B710|nr:cytochrome P450 [Saccharopolyspora sp. 6V]MCA1192127.1 cytochrome P450 [Saccharopolyspora sp. 6V]
MLDPASRAPRASAPDTARIAARVLLPTLATGVIVRRPRVMAFAERRQLDRSAIRLLAELRSRYGDGPLRLPIPGREFAVVLDPAQVRDVLRDSADRFTPANLEKRTALRHFQPHAVLISRGRARARRREFNEDVLEIDRPVHELGPRIAEITAEEGARLAEQAGGRLDWDAFAAGWWRAVRHIVLGAGARDDRRLVELLNGLRSDANWAFLHPRRTARRREFDRRLRAHLSRAEPGSLAGAIARDSSDVDGADQVPHWLFVFDAAAMVAYRALAVLTAQPERLRAVREEVDGADSPMLPLLRSCVLESVRLWPTTPALLRDAVTEASWGGRTIPRGSGLFIYTPLFHRDRRTVPDADRFAPESWLDGAAQQHPGLVPFSAGPGRCPGENLVLLTASTLLAALLRGHEFRLDGEHELGPDGPLPHTLDNFELEFRVAARAASGTR